MELNYLIEEVSKIDRCDEGMEQLRACKNMKKLVECFFDRIDFCLANDFPSREYFERNRGELREHGVFIDEKSSMNSLGKMAFLGRSRSIVTAKEWAISRVYVKHDSRVKIVAKDYAIVMVDALDNAEIVVEESKYGKVIVNLYGDATSGKAYRIIQKNRETYDIQV